MTQIDRFEQKAQLIADSVSMRVKEVAIAKIERIHEHHSVLIKGYTEVIQASASKSKECLEVLRKKVDSYRQREGMQ